MKIIDSKKIRELRREGKPVEVVGRLKAPAKKTVKKPPDVLKEIAVFLKELLSRETPAPIVNVPPAIVNIPDGPKKWRFTVKRNESGFIKEIVAEVRK